jgi:flagellar hook protein FlgE
MALTSTLYTGLSGLNVNQTRLNVVGNNIANVNTVAFKSSRAIFKPQFYVTDEGGSPPSGDSGGTNPSQRGLGAMVAGIERNFAPGNIEPTGKVTDLAIDGEGFFVVRSDAQRFTRDGSFKLNSANQLVTSSGAFVQGYGIDSNFNIIPGSIGDLNVPLGALTTAQATENVTLKGNLNASGTVASGASILTTQLLTTVGGTAPIQTGSGTSTATLLTAIASTSDPATPLFTDGQVFTLAGKKGGRDVPSETFTVTSTTTIDDLTKFFQDGMGVNPLPDDGNAATPLAGVTMETDATDPNSSKLVIVGNMGLDNSLELSATSFSTTSGSSPLTITDGTNAAGLESNPVGESVHTSFVAYDSLGTPLTVGITATLESASDAGTSWRFFAESGDDTTNNLCIGTGTLQFDTTGKLVSTTTPNIVINRANTGAKSPLTIKLDFGSMTALTSRDSEMVMTEQDGSSIGTLDSFSIGADGGITGSFSNGLTRTLGQIALATFTNPEGLVDTGNNQMVPGPSSGVAVISAPQTMGTGSIRGGALELSNVDLSEEFINLIVASTGFSAASRVITTSDQLITELLNSSR